MAATKKKKSKLTRPVNPMPSSIRSALSKAGLMAAYRARPEYQQNDYIGWIERAKLPQTREKRVAQMIEELKDGGRYMNMKWRGRK